MSLNIREWPMWRWYIFNWSEEADSLGSRVFPYFIVAYCGALPFSALMMINVIVAIVLGVFLLALPYLADKAGNIHVLKGLPRDAAGYRWESNMQRLAFEAQEYLRLSKDDRSEYPSNILDIATNPDLKDDQAGTLASEMRETRSRIISRNAYKAQLAARHIPIDDVLEELKNRRAGIDIDVATYKEFAGK